MLRTYLQHIPTWAGEYNPVPLIFVFHGDGEDSIEERNRIAEHWVHRTNEVAIVCPEATFDAVKGRAKWGMEPGERLEDDIAFIDELFADYEGLASVQASCAYAVGMGSGAALVWALASHPIYQHRFLGFAGVGHPMPYTPPADENYAPKPAIYIQGTFDPRWSRTVPRTAAHWVQRNLCKGVPENTLLDARNDAITAVKQVFPPGLERGAAFSFITVLNGGHHWPYIPGVNPHITKAGSTVCTDFSATDEIMSFFNKYARCP